MHASLNSGDEAVCHACRLKDLNVQDFACESKSDFVAQNLETFVKDY
jgi:hypothetical protein